jgi:hypothetical protein
MGRKRSMRSAASAGVICAVAGCSSLLGDFTVGPGTGEEGGTGGGLDAGGASDAPPVEGGGRDAGPDATVDGAADDGGMVDGEVADAPSDGPPAPLNCGTWVYPAPIVLETVSTGTRLTVGAPLIYPIPVTGGTNVRVVVGKNGPVPFTVYSLDRSVTPPSVTTIAPPTSYFASYSANGHRSPGKDATYTVVLAYTRSSPMVSATYEAYVIQDSLANAGPIPSPFPAYSLTPVQATPTALHVLPLAPNDVFTAVENPVTSGGVTTYDLGVGIATPSTLASPLFPVSSSLNSDDFTEMALFNNNTNNTVYVYAENDPSSPGMSAWTVPDALMADGAAPTKRAIGAISASMPSIAENTTQSAADIAYTEANLNGAFTTGETFRAGTIPYASATPDLDTWVSTDLPIVKGYGSAGQGSVFDAPLGLSDGSHWYNDNIMLVGPGLRNNADASNGGVPYGLNYLWMDANGNLRAEGQGNNRLLPELGDFTGVATTALQIGPDGKTAHFAIVWVEQKTDDAGAYSVVSYNELSCQ